MFNFENRSFNLSDISYFHLHLAFKPPFKSMKFISALHFPELVNEQGTSLQISYICQTLRIYKEFYMESNWYFDWSIGWLIEDLVIHS